MIDCRRIVPIDEREHLITDQGIRPRFVGNARGSVDATSRLPNAEISNLFG